jgi:hypothetical protein
MASTPGYAAIPRAPDVAQISTANTNRDGSGTLATLSTGTSGGDAIENVGIVASGTTTPGMIRFFLSKDGGTTKVLIVEQQVPAVTPSGTQPAFSTNVPQLVGLLLMTTSTILYVSTNNAEAFNVVVQKCGL